MAFWSYGNENTPVTEMTSLKTAGRDMPLTSPRSVVGIVVAPGSVSTPPVVPLRSWASRSQRSRRTRPAAAIGAIPSLRNL